MNQNTLYILLVALITWGGVFAYLVRLHFLQRDLDNKIERLENSRSAEPARLSESVHLSE